MAELDKMDIKLLAALEEDARQTPSQIAKKLQTSQQVVSYRLKSLEKRNIIGGYYTIINLTKLGYTNYRVMIRLSHADKQRHEEITTYLKNDENTLWVVDCGGRWDILINIIGRNIIHFSNLLQKLKKWFPENIQNYDILTTIEVRYLGRDYFTKRRRELKHFPYFGGFEEEVCILDKTDLKILKSLSLHARLNALEIARKVGKSGSTVISRIKEMKKGGTIQGFKPFIHLEHTSYSAYKALVKFQNITDQKERECVQYLKMNVHVVAVIKMIGAWDFEIEIEVETKEQMLEITRTFRDDFKEIIKEFEVIPLFHEYKYNFFPGDLLKKDT